MTENKNQLKFKDLKNQVLEPVSYYMKPFNDQTYPGMSMHYHQYFEIMYTYSGSYTMQMLDPDAPNKIKEIVMQPGQFILFDGYVYHRMIMEKGASAFVYNMEFEPRTPAEYNPFGINELMSINHATLFRDTNLSAIAQNKEGYIVLSDTQLVGAALQELILLLTEGINSLEDACSVKLAQTRLFIEISKCLNSLASGSVSYIRKANAYLQANYKRNVKLDEVAEHVGLSKAYLQRQYKKHTCKTILEQINALRVTNAVELLIRSDLKKKKIAAHVGFHNKNQFNYEIKKIYGMPPSEYRQSHVATVDHHCTIHKSYPVLLDEEE